MKQRIPGTVHFVFVMLKPLGERNMAAFMLEFDNDESIYMDSMYGILFGLVS